MLDTINGLPVHILVVHAVVVLLPLGALVTIAATARPAWRPALPWAIALNAVATVAALVAKASGQKLYGRVGQEGDDLLATHTDRGDVLPYFAVALLVASVIAWLLTRQGGTPLTIAAIALVVLAGGAAAGWTFLTGESGSKSVWGDIVANTQAPVDD